MRAMGGAKAIMSDRKSRVRVTSCLNGHAATKGNHRPFPVYTWSKGVKFFAEVD